ncbi:MAG: RNA-binding protein [Patescibacteria group bacterium]|nr:RNA-binding protein [Patescibacteria group bacterium]
MSAKIYVGNLPYECTDQDLQGLFAQFGQVVSAEIVRYKKSRRSKGFGYVRMADAAQAEAAITALNGQEFQGRRLMLAPARAGDPPAEVQEELAKQREDIKRNPPPARKPREERDRSGTGASAVGVPSATAAAGAAGGFPPGETAGTVAGYTPIVQEPTVREAAPADGYTFQPEPYDHELPAGGEHLMGAGAAPEAEVAPAPVEAASSAPEATADETPSGDTPKKGGGIHEAMRAFGTIFSGGRKDDK